MCSVPWPHFLFIQLVQLHMAAWLLPVLSSKFCEIKVTKVLVAQLCPTPCKPMDYGPPGSSVHGILQERLLSSGDCPNPGIEPHSPTLLADSLLSEPWRNLPTQPDLATMSFFSSNTMLDLAFFSLLFFGLKCFASSSSYGRTFYHQDLFEISPIARGLLCLHQLREISLVTLGCLTFLYFYFLSCI